MKNVDIIDYGLGNLFSVARGFEACDAKTNFVTTPKEISTAEYLVLPGVGAFRDGIENLKKQNLIEPIREHVASGKPFMGICLGMQMMMDSSKEFGFTEGLKIIPGTVDKIPDHGKSNEKIKIPHVGWSELSLNSLHNENKICTDLPAERFAYFVHSYTAIPEYPDNRLYDVDYHDYTLSAGITKDLCYGFQFHPEKSGNFGLALIRNFLKL